MRALTVVPRRRDSADVVDIGAPAESDGGLLVDGLAVGICGTDRERAGRRSLERLVTRRRPLEGWREALAPAPHDIKTVLELAA